MRVISGEADSHYGTETPAEDSFENIQCALPHES